MGIASLSSCVNIVRIGLLEPLLLVHSFGVPYLRWRLTSYGKWRRVGVDAIGKLKFGNRRRVKTVVTCTQHRTSLKLLKFMQAFTIFYYDKGTKAYKKYVLFMVEICVWKKKLKNHFVLFVRLKAFSSWFTEIANEIITKAEQGRQTKNSRYRQRTIV